MTLSYKDYLELLQPVSDQKLEAMAQQARQLTLKHFGKTILLYIPLYLGNECDNQCVYCGFGRELKEKRVSLTVDEVLAEAEIIHQKGFRHILLVSGEKRDKVTISYLKEIISKLHEKFESISLEIFPLQTNEYQELFRSGADGLTIYQEAYNKEIYNQVHPSGPKSDYNFRLLTPERAAQAGFYRINIGSLLGLGKW
ncbi:MAG: radical SAM protein, partial [Candidatus Margulisiibacteriota bacterium]